MLNIGYYDQPEGQDALGKMIATNKYAAALGFSASAIDILMISKPQGYAKTITRCATIVGPMMGMASAFTMGAFLSNKLREKDDKLNYVIGACCSAGVMGAWAKSFTGGCVAALAFSFAGILKKLSIEEGWVFFPPVKHMESSIWSHDFTLTDSREHLKNWTTKTE